jgi:hypothetical protein
MKRIFATLLCLTGLFAAVIAGNPNNYSFKSTDEEVALELQRGKGEVLIHLLVKDISQYDHILIERSADSPNYFAQCKYISCADEKTDNGYLLKVDKFPMPGSKDVFYRIKTVTKDGIARAYPAVQLAAVTQ